MTLTFAVARYMEDINWLSKLPAESKIYLFNKGDEITHDLPANVEVHALENEGRESGTYAHFMINFCDDIEDGYTVFTQGDPFEHSPDFLRLMKIRDKWAPLQPLTVCWKKSDGIPNETILDEERQDWIAGCNIRKEFFSLKTYAPVNFFDHGAWGIGNTYVQRHNLKMGTNISAHFFNMCGLKEIAKRAQAADVGFFSYGAIFAVDNRLLRKFVNENKVALHKIEMLSKLHPNYGYMIERCWLHMFGEPFLSIRPPYQVGVEEESGEELKASA